MTLRNRAITALVTACSMLVASSQPLFARSTHPADAGATPISAPRVPLPDLVQDLDLARYTIASKRESLERLLASPRVANTHGEKLRRAIARLDKAWLYVRIAHASGPERRALIRQLPVTTTMTRATDGRSGSYREYVANGKVRVRLFVPDAEPLQRTETDVDMIQPDGSTRADSRSSVDCFYEDEDGAFGGACSTQQEVDDALIVEADLAAGEAAMEADANDAYNEMNNWCQSNYPACHEGDLGMQDELPTSGPSVAVGGSSAVCSTEGPLECIAMGIAAVQQAGSAVLSRVKLYNLANSPAILTISAGALAWKVALALGSVAAAAVFVSASWECFTELE